MLDWLFSDPLPRGAEAPDFTIPDQNSTPWSLSSKRGEPVLLVFYPGDNTPGCTRQLCEIRDHSADWTRYDVQIAGISPQSSKSHQEFISKYGFGFPLLADAGQRVATLYHCNGLFIRRTVYLVGKDGRILHSERGMPTTKQILQSAGLL